MIEPKGTADESLDSSDVYAGSSAKGGEPSPSGFMATKKHKLMLFGGIICILLLGGVVAVVAVLLTKTYSNKNPNAANGGNSDGNPSSDFDFEDVGPDFSGIRGPSLSPSGLPTLKLPTDPPATSVPTVTPSTTPSAGPTNIASENPSNFPTAPTLPPVPTFSPTAPPFTAAPVMPIITNSDTLLTFCVIADVPYYDNEARDLPGQIENQMEGCEFLVHLGDIMRGEISCDEEHYLNLRNMMMESTVPAFIVPGDNEWNDCGGAAAIQEAWGLWETYFMQMENNWNHTLGVVRHWEFKENFYFIQKRTLIFGLNIVGGRVHDETEWAVRLTSEVEWIKEIVNMTIPEFADGFIVMAHAKPEPDHVLFFDPLRDFIRDDLNNTVPVLYLHGDGHSYVYTERFYGEPNYLRIQHEGGVRDPILKILADPSKLGPQVTSAFQVDRQLQFDRK